MEREYERTRYPKTKQLNGFIMDVSYRAPHLHNDLELGMVLSGTLGVCNGVEATVCQPGDMYIVNAKRMHELFTGMENARVLVFQISPELLRLWFPEQRGMDFRCLAVHPYFARFPRIYQLFQALLIDLAYNYFLGGTLFRRRCHAVFDMVSYLLDRFVPTRPVPKTELRAWQKDYKQMSEIATYVERHFREKMLPRDVAQEMGMTPPALTGFIKDTLHITYHEYVGTHRFEYACTLLRVTDKSLHEIVRISGFSDAQTFVRLCQEIFSCTPEEYRRKSPPLAEGQPPESALQWILHPDDSIDILDAHMEPARAFLADFSVWELCGT